MASQVRTTKQNKTKQKQQQQQKQDRRWTPKNDRLPKINKSQHQPLRPAANRFSVSGLVIFVINLFVAM